MTREEIVAYLNSKADFRRETAARVRPGTQAVIKNELYAHSLEQVIAHVKQLPPDDPALIRLDDISYDSLMFDDHLDIHTATIHCSLGKPPKALEWFANWAGMVARLGEGAMDE